MPAAPMKIKLHPMAILIIAFFIWDKNFARLMLSVFLHELGHSAAAFSVGKRNQVLTVTPFGCTLYAGELGGRLRALSVYAAGPLTSLLLLPILSPQTLYVLIFNLIPLLPLDGGRIAAELAGEENANFLGGLALLAGVELCLLHETPPWGIGVILLLHSRYMASRQYAKIRKAADFLRDLY